MRVHRHITDLAGSGLVLIRFLLVAMAFSAVPVLVQQLARHAPAAQPAAATGPHDAALSGPGRATS